MGASSSIPKLKGSKAAEAASLSAEDDGAIVLATDGASVSGTAGVPATDDASEKSSGSGNSSANGLAAGTGRMARIVEGFDETSEPSSPAVPRAVEDGSNPQSAPPSPAHPSAPASARSSARGSARGASPGSGPSGGSARGVSPSWSSAPPSRSLRRGEVHAVAELYGSLPDDPTGDDIVWSMRKGDTAPWEVKMRGMGAAGGG